MKLNDKEFPYSFSQNRLYNDCPRKYKYRYVDGIKEPTNENLELGSAIHKVFELYHVVRLEVAFDWQIIDYDNAILKIIKLKGERYCHQLLQEFSELDIAHTDNNHHREWEVKQDDFVAIIDLVHKVAEQPHIYALADYKVTKKPKTDASIFDEGQLLIYKYMFYNQDLNRCKPEDIVVHYINILPYLAPKIITVTEPQQISMETCEAVYNAAMKTKEKILAGEFPKKKKWCNWCYYRDICSKDNT